MPIPTDFSSPSYWSDRFEFERSFEWLISDDDLLPFIEENLPPSFLIENGTNEVADDGDGLNILHFGSGTSSLGPSLQHHLNTTLKGKGKRKIQVHDSDYVPTPTPLGTGTGKKVNVPFILSDVLSLSSLQENLPGGKKWDMVIDKSTCDAISCGGVLPVDQDLLGEEREISDPIERLLNNLSQITRIGARWISISYSSNRFDNYLSTLPNTLSRINGTVKEQEREMKYGWNLLKRQMISTTYIPGGKRVKDPRTGEERVVHEPETGVWMYVLERV